MIILAMNLADTLSIADKFMMIRHDRVEKTILRSDFGSLPQNTPWHFLSSGQE